MVVHYEDKYTFLKMLILALVYVVSILMVYLRVYQTIHTVENEKDRERKLRGREAIVISTLRRACTRQRRYLDADFEESDLSDKEQF